MGLTSNSNDYSPYNQLSFEPLDNTPVKRASTTSAKTTFIDKQLEELFKDPIKGNVSRVMEQIILICILSGAQGRTISREHLQKMIPKIFEEAEINAASYNNYIVWGLAAAGGLASVAGGAYAAYGINAALSAGGTTAAINNAVQFYSSIQGTGSGIGQFANTSSQLVNQSDDGQRQLRNHWITYYTSLRDQDLQSSQSAEGETSKAEQTLQQLIYALHQIATQILGQQS